MRRESFETNETQRGNSELADGNESDDPQQFSDVLQNIAGVQKVCAHVRRGNDSSQARFSFCHSRITYGRGVHSGRKQVPRKLKCLGGFADVDGHDRRFGVSKFETTLFELLLEELGVRPQFLDEAPAFR